MANRCVRVVDTHDEQLKLWIAGESVHVRAAWDKKQTECCPDFSCCSPSLRWPVEKRREFKRAGRKKREQMLMGSLASMLASDRRTRRKKIAIVG